MVFFFIGIAILLVAVWANFRTDPESNEWEKPPRTTPRQQALAIGLLALPFLGISFVRIVPAGRVGIPVTLAWIHRLAGWVKVAYPRKVPPELGR